MKKIVICMGSSCFSRGNEQNLEYLEQIIEKNGLDVEIDLSGSRCEGKCASGPVICIDDTVYSEVNPGVLQDIIAREFGVKTEVEK